MKNIISFIVFGVSFFIFLLLYLNYDSKGYHYGLKCNFCNMNLPYGLSLKMNSDYPQDFVLLDGDGFELVGSGFRYRQSSFKIKDFLAYGYNDTSVIVKCTDSLNIAKYLVSYETAYKSKKGNPEISFKDLSISDFEQIKDKYQWFEVDEEKANTIRFMKFSFIIGALLSLFFIVKKIFKLRSKKATD